MSMQHRTAPPDHAPGLRLVPSALARLEREAVACRRAEADLADHEALTRALFANGVVGMALADLAGRLILVNAVFALFLGVEPDDLVGTALAAHTHPEDVDLERLPRAELLAGLRSSYSVDQRFFARRGDLVWGRLSVTLVRDADGTPRHQAIVCEDITARVRADEERARLDRRLQETQRLESITILAGGLAHDFTNILTSIQSNADLALLCLPASSPACPSLEQITDAVSRASELTRQLFAYAGGRHITAGAVDVNAAISAITDLLRGGPARYCAVDFRLAPDLPPVALAATQVRQIVINLVVNAAEAIGAGPGRIVVGTMLDELNREALNGLALGKDAEPGPFVCLSVSDTGCGMPAATMARIFDPFFSTKLAGRGLGLASVHTIIHEQRGALWVQSAPDQGTTFHIWLPVTR